MNGKKNKNQCQFGNVNVSIRHMIYIHEESKSEREIQYIEDNINNNPLNIFDLFYEPSKGEDGFKNGFNLRYKSTFKKNVTNEYHLVQFDKFYGGLSLLNVITLLHEYSSYIDYFYNKFNQSYFSIQSHYFYSDLYSDVKIVMTFWFDLKNQETNQNTELNNLLNHLYNEKEKKQYFENKWNGLDHSLKMILDELHSLNDLGEKNRYYFDKTYKLKSNLKQLL